MGDSNPTTSTPDRSIHWPVIGLAIIALAVFANFKNCPPSMVALLVAAVAMFPAAARRLNPLLDRMRHPSGRIRRLITLGLLVLALCYFLTHAVRINRYPFPTLHDEFMYLLQARMLASGHLWLPAHPVGEFFDSFFVIVKPVYASAYFPGTGLAYVPGIWLNQPHWVTSLLVAASCISVLYLVVSRVIDGVGGLLSAILALALDQLRFISMMAMSHGVMLLLFLLATLALLRWRERKTAPRALALGILCGWAAITRPLDALFMLLPMMAWMMMSLRQQPRAVILKSLAALILGALPFLSLQLLFNKAVTGKWHQTPVGLYAQRNFPGLKMGFHHGDVPASKADLEQVRDYHRTFLTEFIQKHARRGFAQTWLLGRLGPAIDETLPARLLLVLLPVGLLCIRCLGTFWLIPALTGSLIWALWPPTPLQHVLLAVSALILFTCCVMIFSTHSLDAGRLAAAWITGSLLFTLAYSFWPPYLKHYGLVVAPVFIFGVVSAGEILRNRLPETNAAFFLSIVILAVGSLPEITGRPERQPQLPYLKHVHALLANLEQTPAIVLFKYHSGLNLHEEPVFNLNTAWPDDALVIRAQDRGAENQRIFEYYARTQPQRFFYRYDATMAQLTPLGQAKELAKSRD